MPYIVHAISEDDWTVLKEKGEYRPKSLDSQGFVHCSKPGQIVVVADANFTGRDDLRLLILAEERIEAPVRYEANESITGSAYPHIYGPLKLEYVVESFSFTYDETGFRLPERLFEL